MSLAILPGSFDPMTLGHRALAKEVAEQYDEVVVAVMINRDKTYLFPLEERVRLGEYCSLPPLTERRRGGSSL